MDMDADELGDLITGIQESAKSPLRSIKLDWKAIKTNPNSLNSYVRPCIEIIYENGIKKDIDESKDETIAFDEGFGADLSGSEIEEGVGVDYPH